MRSQQQRTVDPLIRMGQHIIPDLLLFSLCVHVVNRKVKALACVTEKNVTTFLHIFSLSRKTVAVVEAYSA